MTNTSSRLTSCVIGAVALALASTSFAMSPPPPGPGFHGPSMHQPASRHCAPPSPHGHPHGHHYSYDWAGAILTGAAILGVASLISQANAKPAPAATTTNVATSAPVANKVVYWCEAERGFYPQIKACPTGWTAVPAP